MSYRTLRGSLTRIFAHSLKQSATMISNPRIYCTTGKMVIRQSPGLAPMSSSYMRKLPSPALTLHSTEGNRLFDEARAAGTATGALEILSQLQTQGDIRYCGLSSLITILNALHVDPQCAWKGPWRWYDETMLLDAESLEKVQANGISFQQLVDVVPRDKVKLQSFFATESSLPEFREHIVEATSSNTSFILLNFLRRVLGQTGGGHFSPIAAYNAASDVVLVSDVARFKYPPFWISCSILWEAISTTDTSGKSRGFMIISKT